MIMLLSDLEKRTEAELKEEENKEEGEQQQDKNLEIYI